MLNFIIEIFSETGLIIAFLLPFIILREKKMKTFNYGGRTYEYTDQTTFYLELGRYENRYTVYKTYPPHVGAFLELAMAEYESYLVENGWKKRLTMVNDNVKTVLAKVISKR